MKKLSYFDLVCRPARSGLRCAAESACSPDRVDDSVPTIAAPTVVPPTLRPTATQVTSTIAPSPAVPPQPTATTPAQTGGEFTLALEPVIEGGLMRPDYLTHAGDDRLFVVEQPGRIRIIQGGQLLDRPFLDIADKVTTDGNEQGLLSVAFHPDYQTNGQFFVNYTRQQRWRDGDRALHGFQR